MVNMDLILVSNHDLNALLSVFNDKNKYCFKSCMGRNQNIDRRKQDWKLLKGRAVVE